jgi:FkbM family methyltransferase
MHLRTTLKNFLERNGLYVRAAEGLPLGFDLGVDLRKYGIRPTCALDIGAHHGQTALGYVSKFPGCRVFAFEPVSSNFATLCEATAAYPTIIPVHAAVGDQAGSHDIWLSAENSQAHSLVTATGRRTECVDVLTIDDFCRSRQITPDFIKLDVEGYELKALAGAKETLASQALKAIVTEATFDPDDTDHTQIADLMKALRPTGFLPVAIHDQCHWYRTKQLEYFNALFVRR